LLQTDPVRLRQILMNLVGNAVKFTERGWVRVMAYNEARTGDDQEWLVFEVEDTGIGMTEEQLSRLFRPFEQADTSVTRRFGGTGLGLRICRRLARLLGGRIDVASTMDEGSTFVLRLPAQAAEMPDFLDPRALAPNVSPAAPSVPEKVDLAGVRVLVVDDGVDNRRLLAAVLKRAGARVEAVAGAGEAYSRLDSSAGFDVVLMDMQMPEIDGLTAVRHLRDRGESIPVIAVTANAMSEERDRCLAAGCDGFASKPIDRHALVALIGRLVAQGPRDSGSQDE
ncbi:MAG: response regulator, partial [Planctomycetes bacterium]|nr:response regulator [Planctomycetota bacterium]